MTTNDTLFGYPAVVVGQVKFDGGAAVFDGTQGSFLQLPHRSTLQDFQIITVELWATVDENTSPNSFLFSFGGPDNDALCVQKASDVAFRSLGRAHIVVVCDRRVSTASLFVNGKLSKQRPLIVDTAEVNENHDFIGRSGFGASGRLKARIEEFRIYYGALTPAIIYSNFLTGFESRIALTSAHTKGNIKVDFYATTKQWVRVNAFGGTSSAARMFGSETSFTIIPVDTKCRYIPIVMLHDDDVSSVAIRLPAMNYSVNLYSMPHASPKYSTDDACMPGSSVACDCAASLPPYEYFKQANQLTQPITIVAANSSEYTLNYTYRSGLCMMMEGDEVEEFSKEVGNLGIMPGEACFAAGSKILHKGDNVTVRIVLLERYPSSPDWVKSNGVISSPDNVAISFGVEDARLYVLDLVSGQNSVQNIAYNDTMVAQGVAAYTTRPAAVSYQITAADPQTAGTMDWMFSVTAQRLSPGPASVVSAVRFVPVLGVIPKEVPNVYPVSTDSDMIFLVIRDPPGGRSQTIIHAGTTMSFAMSIKGMDANDDSNVVSFNNEMGEDGELKTWFGVGAGTIQKVFNVVGVSAVDSSVHFEKSVERINSDSFALSFTFTYDFATSLDPFIAGHPSDVIVGGGVDLIVSEALVGTLHSPIAFVCVSTNLSTQWSRAKHRTAIGHVCS